MTKEYDLIVIGGGSGGVRCARVAASLGAKVAIAEGSAMGGTCVNLGCIPKKLFAYSAQMSATFDMAEHFGWDTSTPDFDLPGFIDRKDKEIKRLNGIYTNLLKQSGVDIYPHFARFIGSCEIEVGTEQLRAERIVIATGGTPNRGSYPGAEHVITSDEAFSLKQVPASVLIEGGGYISVEFAGIFNGWGSQVEFLYRGPMFLRGFDHDMRDFLAQQMREKGISLNFNTEIKQIEKTDEGLFRVTLNSGQTTEVDLVFSAIGRQPNTDHLGLENTHVTLSEKGYIEVDEQFATQDKHIFAIGDVIGRVPLTPVAIKEGTALARSLFAAQPVELDYNNIPTAIFSHPEMACVGLTEEKAREKYGEIKVYTSDFRPLKYTLGESSERAMMKLITRADTDTVLGIHMVGESAAEILQGFAVALSLEVTKEQLDKVVGIHPTAAEEWVTLR